MPMKDFRYLVVDDHFLLRQMVTNTLKDAGAATIDWASDGGSALEKLAEAAAKNTPYDIVFLDWSMPDMSGYDVLVAMRQNPKLKNASVIMLTSEAEDASIKQALAAGARDYITKPYSAETILAKLQIIEMGKKG